MKRFVADGLNDAIVYMFWYMPCSVNLLVSEKAFGLYIHKPMLTHVFSSPEPKAHR